MAPSIKSLECLCEFVTGENRVGSKQRRKGEREREQQINRVRGGVLDRKWNGVGWKWPLVEMDTWVFLAKQINTINRLSIILGGSQMLPFHWRLNIRSHDNVFCHKCFVFVTSNSTFFVFFFLFFDSETNWGFSFLDKLPSLLEKWLNFNRSHFSQGSSVFSSKVIWPTGILDDRETIPHRTDLT